MAVQTATMRDALANAYHTTAAYGALSSTAPSGTAGTELTGGSPAYARKPLTWGTGNSGTASATFDVASGSTVAGGECYTAVSAGTYLDGNTVTSQAFASQGTYAATFTYTQS
jgi:hypothetical protein